MVILLLLLLIFQVSAVADIPILDVYAIRANLTEQNADNGFCVTVQIKENTPNAHRQIALQEHPSSQPNEKELPPTFSFERLFYYENDASILTPTWLNVFAILPIPPPKESKIFEVEALPS